MMSPRLALFFSLSLLLSVGCTARSGSGGGGGGLIDPDAGGAAKDGSMPATDSGGGGGADVIAPAVDAVAPGNDAVVPPQDVLLGEDRVKPPVDAPVGPRCGDGTCGEGESCTSCSQDCGPCPARCGDGMCSPAESCTSCPADCGQCPTTCTATSCGACAESSACGWCRSTNSCITRAGASCADLVTSSSACAVTPTTNITSACNVAMTNGTNDCGFVRVTTYTCAPGSTLTFGCVGGADAGACGFSGGTCTGDPLMRICAGNTATGCAYAARILPQNPGLNGVTADDDGCGFCPWVRIACPSDGAVTVFARAYDISMASTASCAVARM